MRKLLAQGIYYQRGIVHGEGCLGDKGELGWIAHLKPGNIVLVFDQVDRTAMAGVVTTHGAFDFGVTRVADQNALLTAPGEALHLQMHLGYQRASGIKYLEATLLGILLHRTRNAEGGEDHDDIVGYLIQLLNEYGTTVTQAVDHKAVVHHFVANIDRRPEDIQRTVDDPDGTIDPGTEAAGIGQLDSHGVGLHGDIAHFQCVWAGFTSNISTSKVKVRPASG